MVDSVLRQEFATICTNKKAVGYSYGYDEQVQAAYRHPTGKKRPREYAVLDESQTDTKGLAVALFPDGSRWSCPQVTNQEVLGHKRRQATTRQCSGTAHTRFTMRSLHAM